MTTGLINCGRCVVGVMVATGDGVDEALIPKPAVDASAVPALYVQVTAEPTNLAVVRARVREWLEAVGIDTETTAELVLAAGEAASNAAEHAHDETGHKVELTVTAAVTAAGVHLAVCDDGRWEPPPASPGTRGHGLRVIAALVDTVQVSGTDNGTTVEMTKELTR